jgi:hypothetical protein
MSVQSSRGRPLKVQLLLPVPHTNLHSNFTLLLHQAFSHNK